MLDWTHSRLGEIWISNEGMRSWRWRWPVALAVGLRGGYHFVGCAAVANQLAAAWMWLTGAIHAEYGSLILSHFLLFCETHDLVWELIRVSEKRMKNSFVKIIDNIFEKWRRWVISFKSMVTFSNPCGQQFPRYSLGHFRGFGRGHSPWKAVVPKRLNKTSRMSFGAICDGNHLWYNLAISDFLNFHFYDVFLTFHFITPPVRKKIAVLGWRNKVCCLFWRS